MTFLPRQRVLVPADFSEHDAPALAVGVELAGGPAGVHLVHVLAPLHPADPATLAHITPGQRRERVEQALRARLGDAAAHSTVHVAIGSPADEILRVAQAHDVDLIVMPSHGRGGLARFAIGSVAERVVRKAHCPVLVLRRPVSDP